MRGDVKRKRKTKRELCENYSDEGDYAQQKDATRGRRNKIEIWEKVAFRSRRAHTDDMEVEELVCGLSIDSRDLPLSIQGSLPFSELG